MSARVFHPDGAQPAAGQVFVFGSNLSGLHAGGAARAAHERYGAEWGVAEGRTGSSYAIPTMSQGAALPLLPSKIKLFAQTFIEHAEAHPELQFFVTRVGCGIAGYRDADIAPMFAGAPLNCSLPDTWQPIFETAGAST